jgi:hypothetical protein
MLLNFFGVMKRIATPQQHQIIEVASDDASRQQERVKRAQGFGFTNEAEDWSFLRMFFPPRINLIKARADESAD